MCVCVRVLGTEENSVSWWGPSIAFSWMFPLRQIRHPLALSGYGLAPLPISFAVISAKDYEASHGAEAEKGKREHVQ